MADVDDDVAELARDPGLALAREADGWQRGASGVVLAGRGLAVVDEGGAGGAGVACGTEAGVAACG